MTIIKWGDGHKWGDGSKWGQQGTIYDETVALAATSSLSAAPTVTFSQSVALPVISALSESGFQDIPVGISLPIATGLAAEVQTLIESLLSLNAGVQTGAYWTAALDIVAAHLNALEAKVGVDGSAVTTSLDYKVGHQQPFPVGAVFLSVVATNPATLLGYGTWSQVAQGQMLVGYKAGDADFGTVEATGGSKTKNLAHTHSTPSLVHSCNNNQRGDMENSVVGTISDHAAGTTGSGGSATQDVLNPYFVVYVWKRTA